MSVLDTKISKKKFATLIGAGLLSIPFLPSAFSAFSANIDSVATLDTLQDVTNRGASTTTESTFSGGIKNNTLRSTAIIPNSISVQTYDGSETMAIFASGGTSFYKHTIYDATGSDNATTIYHDGTGKPLEIINTGTGNSVVVNTDDFIITNTGKIGIGITAPACNLHTLGTSINASLSSVTGIITLEGSSTNQLTMGGQSSSPYGMYLQTKNKNNDGSTTYPLLLNPLGGNVGIGITAPTSKLDVRGGNVVFNEDGGAYDFRIEGDANPYLLYTKGSTDQVVVGSISPGYNSLFSVNYQHNGSKNYEAAITAINDVNTATNLTANLLYGLNFVVQKRGAGNFGNMYGIISTPYISGGGSISTTRAFFAQNASFRDATATGTVTSATVYFAGSPTFLGGSTGTITNTYGLYMATQAHANVTNAYGIYQVGTSDRNYFQGAVGIGTLPNANAALDVASTTKAFMPPRMTTAQRDAISSPTAGMVIYNTTTSVLNFHNGTSWGAV